MVRVGVVGSGYWGPNLIRNLYGMEGQPLHVVCDVRQERLAAVNRQYPTVRVTTNYQEMLGGEVDVDAVVVAVPARDHYTIARAALERGKHVLVEKPLAMTGDQCLDLIGLARKNGLTLMVGHTFLYSPATLKLRDLITQGELGDIYYIYTARLNLGQIRQDVNALWNLAPHDVAIGCFLFGEQPCRATARGYAYLQPGIEDVVFANFDFPSGRSMHTHVSWLDPGKVRRVVVVGSRRMAVYDDTDADEPLRLYDKGVSRDAALPAAPQFGSFGEFKLLLRSGDVHLPRIAPVEPLRAECEHFLDCIKNGLTPRTDAISGMQVVTALEAAQRSLESGGAAVDIRAVETLGAGLGR